ncbi:MAG TPA: signal peptidase I [Terracidiphilus sp.]|nr:signal peptidase I [Terracidiphilus sp.]
MTKKKSRADRTPPPAKPEPAPSKTQEESRRVEQAPGEETSTEETPFEAFASICSVLAVLLFIQTFIGQNFVIPSGSMEKTLLIGDHLVVDRVTLAPPAQWAPFIYYREPRRGDVVVFIKPVPDQVNGKPEYLYLVKRLIGIPGDHIHLNDGTVYINGVAQYQPHAQPTTPMNFVDYLDDFPAVPMTPALGATDAWSVAMPSYVKDGNLVVPPGEYFMMGDNRHDSLDSRFWGFVPRANIVGRPLFNYWSFPATESDYEQPGLGARIHWFGHVMLHFFTQTRWSRTFHVIR